MLSIEEFAGRVKEKYPVYADWDDEKLARRIVEKYPVYADQVEFPPAPEPVRRPQGRLFGVSRTPEQKDTPPPPTPTAPGAGGMEFPTSIPQGRLFGIPRRPETPLFDLRDTPGALGEYAKEEAREALKEPLASIVDIIRVTLERTPPELSADLVDRGLIREG